jgi:transposase-like protein
MSSISELYFNDKDLRERWTNIHSNIEGELKREACRALKRLMETSMEIEVQDLIGEPWQHMPDRISYRNGYRYRSLLSQFGYINDIKCPRLRSGAIKCRFFDAYQQHSSEVDKLVLEMFLAGVSTRRVKEVCIPILGRNAISAGSVSNITKSLNALVEKYHQRQLRDDYIYLIADGIYLNVKNPVLKKRRCILVVYGITSSGIQELIGFQLAPSGESQIAWEHFLNRMYHRGLKGSKLQLIVRDGCEGLKNALATVFSHVLQQHCWAHKLRNVANNLPKKIQAACIAHAKKIYEAPDRKTALKIFKSWVRKWNPMVPKAVHCLTKDFDYMLNFFAAPVHLRIKLRTSNIIERNFREVRRRTRPMSCFQNSDSLQRIIFAVFHRQNLLWKDMPIEITHKI